MTAQPRPYGCNIVFLNSSSNMRQEVIKEKNLVTLQLSPLERMLILSLRRYADEDRHPDAVSYFCRRWYLGDAIRLNDYDNPPGNNENYVDKPLFANK